MFSSEYFEISKSTCFEEYLPTVASDVALGVHPQMNIAWDFLNPLSPLLFSELWKQNSHLPTVNMKNVWTLN